MSPTEAIGYGAASGVGVVSLGTLFIRHLVTRWLSQVDELPQKLEEIRDEFEKEVAKIRREIDAEARGLRERVDTGTSGVRSYAEHEFQIMRESGHELRRQVGLDTGNLANRVTVAERDIQEQKGEMRHFREDLRRVDANLVMVATKLGLQPLMPEERG